VLVIATHPDDEIGCGGTLLLHRRARDEVHVAYVTDGRASRAGGLGPDDMAMRRKQEADAVAPLFGLAGSIWLGFREGEWDEARFVERLRALLRERSPHVIYVPSQVDFHPEHIRVARCVATALGDDGGARIRASQLQVPLTPVLTNLVAPIGAVDPELRSIMQCYATQLRSIERCIRMKWYAAAFYGLDEPAEEFWDMDAATFRRVHATPGPVGVFRSVRARAFTDPLAYLRGLHARRALLTITRAP